MRVCAHDASHVEYQTVGEPLGHTFSGIICTTCGAVDLNAIKTRASATVSIHDPSILRAYVDVNGNVYPTAPKDIEVQDIYFLFGTHRGCAVSLDMEKWVTFSLSFYAEGTTTISTSDSEIFKSAAAWSNNSSSQIAGNLWAPDIIYNPVLEKWCVYYSMNGNAEDWMNSIFMMTSDHIAGPYVFDGFVVFSGMDKNSSGAGNDEYTKVTGEDEVAARYFTDGANWGGTYGSSCIDPVVIYDENGELWMFYGSWSGGIFLIKLDNETGLRDYTYDYGYTADDFSEDGAVWEGTGLVYDPYMGIHVAGGYYVSGEGAYVKYIDGYYYLFLTYGYLDSVGGYNMRIFRCETIDGRYVDPTGDWAVFGSFMLNYGDNMKYGVSFMQNYVWSWWSKGEVSQGHNSIYVDDDGRVFIIYHTRFNDGSETHNVRVHELVANEDGWYLAAPFRKSSTDQIVSDKTAADLAGTWGVIVHSNVDYTVRECNTDQALYLNADGTISGLYTGTWYLNGEYITLVTNNGTFKGVVMQQYMDGVSIDGFDGVTYTFTAMNENELCLWGCLYPSGEYFIDEIEASVVLPTELIDSVAFPTSGAWGAIITYTSSDESVLSATGEVRVPATDTVVTVTATIRCGTEVRTKVFQINVLSKESIADRLVVVDGEYIQDMYGGIDAGGRIASNDYINENTGLSVSFNISNYTNANTVVIKGMNTNYSIALGRIQNGNNNVTAASATASDAALALLEEMGLEATTANYTKLFLCEGSSCLVTISFNLDGSISLYRDGELMLTYAGTLKIGNRNAVLVSAVNASMISQIQLYGLSVNSSISNVVIAYAVDFDAEQYVEPEEAPKDTIAVIGTESDTVSGTYEAELGDWTLEEKVSGDFKVTYSFRVEAPSLTTDATDNNWYIKVGDWVLGANYVSLDAANGYVTLNGVTYNAQYDWETFCALYAKADVTVVIERIGDTTTVTATIKPRVFGYYGAIDYTATYKTGGDDLTVAIGGKDCLVSVYSLNVSYTGAISEGGVTIEARENITADSGISLSFWLQNSINLSDWHPLINANGYIITYGNLDSFTVETSLGGQNCYPALTTQNGVWNSMIVSDAAYFTVNVTESGIDIYKNGTLALRYSSTGKEGTYVKQFAAELLAEIEENGFYFAPEFIATDGSTVYPEIFDLTIGTALTEKEIADMYYSVID